MPNLLGSIHRRLGFTPGGEPVEPQAPFGSADPCGCPQTETRLSPSGHLLEPSFDIPPLAGDEVRSRRQTEGQ